MKIRSSFPELWFGVLGLCQGSWGGVLLAKGGMLSNASFARLLDWGGGNSRRAASVSGTDGVSSGIGRCRVFALGRGQEMSSPLREANSCQTRIKR